MFSENIYILIFIDTPQLKLYNISVKKIERKLVNKMKECTVFVINKTTGEQVDEFVTDYVNDKQLEEFMDNEIHNYDISYNNLLYFYQF